MAGHDIPLSVEDEAAAQLIVGRVEALKAEIKRLRAALKTAKAHLS